MAWHRPYRTALMLFAGIATYTANAHAAAPTRIRQLTGTWVVTNVRVADSPVQAVEVDDPLFMGAVLTISPARMEWHAREDKLRTFTDVCPDPGLSATGAIRCSAGPFGPPGSHLRAVGRKLRLEWYDGAILILTRAGR